MFPADKMYFVVDGKFEIYRSTPYNNQIFEKDTVFGEMNLLYTDNIERKVRCVEKGTLLVLRWEQYRRIK